MSGQTQVVVSGLLELEAELGDAYHLVAQITTGVQNSSVKAEEVAMSLQSLSESKEVFLERLRSLSRDSLSLQTGSTPRSRPLPNTFASTTSAAVAKDSQLEERLLRVEQLLLVNKLGNSQEDFVEQLDQSANQESETQTELQKQQNFCRKTKESLHQLVHLASHELSQELESCRKYIRTKCEEMSSLNANSKACLADTHSRVFRTERKTEELTHLRKLLNRMHSSVQQRKELQTKVEQLERGQKALGERLDGMSAVQTSAPMPKSTSPSSSTTPSASASRRQRRRRNCGSQQQSTSTEQLSPPTSSAPLQKTASQTKQASPSAQETTGPVQQDVRFKICVQTKGGARKGMFLDQLLSIEENEGGGIMENGSFYAPISGEYRIKIDDISFGSILGMSLDGERVPGSTVGLKETFISEKTMALTKGQVVQVVVEYTGTIPDSFKEFGKAAWFSGCLVKSD